MKATPCDVCGMKVREDEFHPHVHCMIWMAYKRNPEDVLAEIGYTRDRTAWDEVMRLRA